MPPRRRAHGPRDGTQGLVSLTKGLRIRLSAPVRSQLSDKTSSICAVLVSAQGRKIIFTTNLPNVGDIDEALVRPGRCFGTVRTRALERREAELLLSRICGEGPADDQKGVRRSVPASARSITLAALYHMVNAEG
jgi:hypothetical protein